MKEAVKTNPPCLILCGDFNIRDIGWKYERSLPGAPPDVETFLQGIRDCLLIQYILEPTRYRQGQNPQICFFSNEEDIIQDVEFLPGVGQSDRISIHFSVVCQKPEKREHTHFYQDWKHADFNRINARLQSYNLEDKIHMQTVQEACDTTSEL